MMKNQSNNQNPYYPQETLERIRFMRRVKILKGQIRIWVHVYPKECSDPLLYWFTFTDSGLITTNSARIFSEYFFPSLTSEEVVNCFGQLYLSHIEGAKFNRTEGPIVIPASQENLKRATKAILKWLRDGVKRCAHLSSKRELDKWAWERAISDFPFYSIQPDPNAPSDSSDEEEEAQV